MRVNREQWLAHVGQWPRSTHYGDGDSIVTVRHEKLDIAYTIDTSDGRHLYFINAAAKPQEPQS
jgi:hypothetical protein